MKNRDLRASSIFKNWWKEQTGLPLTLGGNVVRKDIPSAAPARKDLSEIIRESIDYGLAHREEAVRHSLPYARDMDANLAGKFMGVCVDGFARDYGEVGRDAVRAISGGGARQRFRRNRLQDEVELVRMIFCRLDVDPAWLTLSPRCKPGKSGSRCGVRSAESG